MKVEKILWPTDLSGSAEHALDYVRSLTEKYQAEIHVLYVIVDLAHHESWYGELEKEHIDRVLKWEHEKASERLERICTEQLEGCPLYIRHVAVGNPAEEILKLVDQEKIDLVVMTTQGASSRFGFGSVADKVVKNAPVPVVTIPPGGESQSGAAGG